MEPLAKVVFTQRVQVVPVCSGVSLGTISVSSSPGLEVLAPAGSQRSHLVWGCAGLSPAPGCLHSCQHLLPSDNHVLNTFQMLLDVFF